MMKHGPHLLILLLLPALGCELLDVWEAEPSASTDSEGETSMDSGEYEGDDPFEFGGAPPMEQGWEVKYPPFPDIDTALNIDFSDDTDSPIFVAPDTTLRINALVSTPTTKAYGAVIYFTPGDTTVPDSYYCKNIPALLEDDVTSETITLEYGFPPDICDDVAPDCYHGKVNIALFTLAGDFSPIKTHDVIVNCDKCTSTNCLNPDPPPGTPEVYPQCKSCSPTEYCTAFSDDCHMENDPWIQGPTYDLIYGESGYMWMSKELCSIRYQICATLSQMSCDFVSTDLP